MSEVSEGEGGYVLRNHISLIAKYILVIVVFAAIFFVNLLDTLWENLFKASVVFILLLGACVFPMYFWWKKTTFTFGDTEILRVTDTVFRSVKHIQYTRLASVSVKRDIIDRIFGTSTLTFNVNSSVNATSAEATLVLKRDVADELRNRLNSMIFEKEMTVEEDREVETLIKVTNSDVIMHAVFAQPTYMSIFGLIMLFYSVVMLFVGNSGGFITAAILFAISEIIPFISIILKYYNYRVYRVGDTITIEGGLITTTRSSFRVNKISSVRMRSPLMARALGMTALEVEVVGLSDGEDGNKPVLCPLKKRADAEALLADLLPELYFEPTPEHQPRRALIPMMVADSLYTVIIVGVFVAIFIFAESTVAGLGNTWSTVVTASEVAAAIGLPVLLFARSGLAQRNRTVDMGRDSFMFVYGGYDVSTEYVNYDKVQFVALTSSPLQRRFDTARCSVQLMSSVGFRSIKSGLFDPDDLVRISDEIMDRIRDGRYDYRKYV